MSAQMPSFFVRFFLAFGVFFRVLSDAEFAAGVSRLRRGKQLPSSEKEEARPEPQLVKPPPDSALQLLGLLQQEGRFIDFLEEGVEAFSDAEVGAAARVVHEGCRKAVHEHFELVPIREEPEGTRLTLQAGFDASAVRMTGNVVGQAPYTGNLVHRGWRATEVRLPRLSESHDVGVLAPAELEL